MLIEGKQKCEDCKKELEWVYQLPQRGGSSLKAETIPKDKIQLYSVTKSIEKDGYRVPLAGSVYCPECGHLNYVEVEDSSDK